MTTPQSATPDEYTTCAYWLEQIPTLSTESLESLKSMAAEVYGEEGVLYKMACSALRSRTTNPIADGLERTVGLLHDAYRLVEQSRGGEWGETSVFDRTQRVLADLTMVIEALVIAAARERRHIP